jgi:hypothetical protein
MRTLVQMANRSDRREDKPRTPWAMKARLDDWLLARGFHFGQEGKSSIRVIPLHLQAEDTNAGLTLRLRRRRVLHQLLNAIFIRGPTSTTLDIEEESRYGVHPLAYGRPRSDGVLHHGGVDSGWVGDVLRFVLHAPRDPTRPHRRHHAASERRVDD